MDKKSNLLNNLNKCKIRQLNNNLDQIHEKVTEVQEDGNNNLQSVIIK